MLSHIIEIESCLNNIYTTNFHDPSLNNAYSFVRINLEIVSEVISQKRGPETFKPFEGKELEYEYWMLLHARISSMYDNTNQNLEFPNLHDYLGEISR